MERIDQQGVLARREQPSIAPLLRAQGAVHVHCVDLSQRLVNVKSDDSPA